MVFASTHLIKILLMNDKIIRIKLHKEHDMQSEQLWLQFTKITFGNKSTSAIPTKSKNVLDLTINYLHV